MGDRPRRSERARPTAKRIAVFRMFALTAVIAPPFCTRSRRPERAIVAEMVRLVRPGGMVSALAVLYADTEDSGAARAARGPAGLESLLPEHLVLASSAHSLPSGSGVSLGTPPPRTVC